MATRRSKPADYIRLRTALESRGTNIQKASIDLGHADSYLYKVDYIGKLPEIEILGLKSLYGIEYDEIKPLKTRTVTADVVEPEPVTLEQAQDGVVDTLHRIEAKMADRPTLSVYDKLALENAAKAIDRDATMTNAQTQAIMALTDAVKRIADKADRLEQLLSDPTALYKAVFIPVYSAVKCADAEQAEQAKSAVPRRMDGSIDYSKMARRP